jgi:beta-lactam-binding protein with PASTA domain
MEPFFVMPYLKNRSFEKVFNVLRPMGITIEKIKSEVRDDLDAGTVLSQTPPAGSKIKKKDSVSFVVSMKSSDENLTTRHAEIVFDVPDINPKRLQIDVFDSSGTRTVYNKMASPLEHVELGVNVTGKASALIYLNQEFVKELPIP